MARCQSRPIAHVAAEMGISRQCASKWVSRYRRFGQVGLLDRSSTPRRQPTATPAAVMVTIEAARRRHRCARRIAFDLGDDGVVISRRTVTRHLARLGLNRLRHLDPCGASNRRPAVTLALRPGHMVHVDVKKVGVIPDGGGWRGHGRGSAQAKTAARAKARHARRLGYTYLHSAIDGHTRLAYTEALPDETAATAVEFLDRARVFFAAHGITSIERVVTDNGSCYRASDYTTAVTGLGARQQRIRPYTPRHNGKIERYNRTLTDEFLYARLWTSEQHRTDQLSVWNVHYNYHRRHTAIGDIPPAAACAQRVTNVMASFS